MKRNSLHRKDSKKSLRFLHDAVAKKKRKKKKPEKKGKTRQDLDGRIHRLAGSIGQGGRVLFGVRTRTRNLLRNP